VFVLHQCTYISVCQPPACFCKIRQLCTTVRKCRPECEQGILCNSPSYSFSCDVTGLLLFQNPFPPPSVLQCPVVTSKMLPASLLKSDLPLLCTLHFCSHWVASFSETNSATLCTSRSVSAALLTSYSQRMSLGCFFSESFSDTLCTSHSSHPLGCFGCFSFRIRFRHSLYLTFPSESVSCRSFNSIFSYDVTGLLLSFRICFSHSLYLCTSLGCYSFRIPFRHLYPTFLSTLLGCYLSESVSCSLSTLQGCFLFRIHFPSLF
jgi:hypothetical protein